MHINLYESHKQITIFYYILFYWVLVQILTPIGSLPSTSPSPASAKVSCQGGDFFKEHMFDDFL